MAAIGQDYRSKYPGWVQKKKKISREKMSKKAVKTEEKAEMNGSSIAAAFGRSNGHQLFPCVRALS
jgi:hypothetical protein